MFNRSIIVEQKELFSLDRAYLFDRLTRTMDSENPGYDVAGMRIINVKSDPSKDQRYTKLMRDALKGLENIVKSADEQTKQTKDFLKMPHADGIIIILNSRVKLLLPNLVNSRVFERLTMKQEKGYRYPHNRIFLLVNEAHDAPPVKEVQGNTVLESFPSLISVLKLPEATPRMAEFAARIAAKWAESQQARCA